MTRKRVETTGIPQVANKDAEFGSIALAGQNKALEFGITRSFRDKEAQLLQL